MIIRTSVAAATAVAGYDTIQSEVNNRLPTARKLIGVAFTGSAAAGDTVVEVMINNKSVGKFENSATGTAIDMKRDFKSVNEYVAANALVQCVVRTAPGTNPLVSYLEFAPLASRSGGYRRRSYGKSNYRRTTRRF